MVGRPRAPECATPLNGYHAPTDPPTIFLDTRTQREYDNPDGAARLIGQAGRKATLAAAVRAGRRPDQPLILVSPVPVYGLALHERAQTLLKHMVGAYAVDLEEWQSNPQGPVDFMTCLIDELQLPSCLFISGDVHYGMNLTVACSWKDQGLPITQLVSSAQEHAGLLSKTALNLLGKLVPNTREWIGWDRPPQSARSTVVTRLMHQPVNPQEWSDEAPIFLAPRRARQLSIHEPPDHREQRQYVPALGPRTLTILGDNNVGLVSVRGDEVSHRLLYPTGGDVCIYTATMRMRPTTPRVREKRPTPTQGVQSEMWSLAGYPEGLGHSGLSVSAMGLRCMGMWEFDGVGDEQESSATIPQRSNLLGSISKTQSLTLLWQMLNLRELQHNSST